MSWTGLGNRQGQTDGCVRQYECVRQYRRDGGREGSRYELEQGHATERIG